ncbi:mitochondrial carrier [Lentinula edodes]|uniref:Mitochondrial carrier n=1 Tax=Lentinula edodes TaxID=5353 RepID=A0A1Q3EED3_LENED|nr:mitochondrial carrier [Lentinula edodes]
MTKSITLYLMPTRDKETNFRRFSAGSISGLISVLFTYPLEVFRVRLAFHTKFPEQSNNSLLRSFKQIYHEQATDSRPASGLTPNTNYYFKQYPILKFYRGFSATLIGMIPIRFLAPRTIPLFIWLTLEYI